MLVAMAREFAAQQRELLDQIGVPAELRFQLHAVRSARPGRAPRDSYMSI
jgi:hypothetical protein